MIAPMRTRYSPPSPETWLSGVFDCKAVAKGEVIRRKSRDIRRYAGMDRFMAEVDRRGYCAFENAGQVVVFCNREPIRRLGRHPAKSPKERQHESL